MAHLWHGHGCWVARLASVRAHVAGRLAQHTRALWSRVGAVRERGMGENHRMTDTTTNPFKFDPETGKLAATSAQDWERVLAFVDGVLIQHAADHGGGSVADGAEALYVLANRDPFQPDGFWDVVLSEMDMSNDSKGRAEVGMQLIAAVGAALAEKEHFENRNAAAPQVQTLGYASEWKRGVVALCRWMPSRLPSMISLFSDKHQQCRDEVQAAIRADQDFQRRLREG